MTRSESVVNIVPAILKAQASFPAILKTKTAEIKSDKASYSFTYAPLDEIVNKIRPSLLEAGLFLMQGVEGDALVTTIWHESGEYISHAMKLPAVFATIRAYGSELSYRRRYSVAMVFGLVAEDDDDGRAAEVGASRKAKSDPPSGSGAEIKKEAFDRMDVKEQEWLRNIAANVTALLDDKRDDDAYGYLRNQKLDVDEQVAIQWLFGSKQRTALSKAGARYQQMEKASGSATSAH